jgi:hypothetical protein
MELPNLPTDNLYKFLAIVGLILFLVAFLYPGIIFISDKHFQKLYDPFIQYEGFHTEEEILNNKIQALTQKGKPTEEDLQRKVGYESRLDQIKIEIAKVNATQKVWSLDIDTSRTFRNNYVLPIAILGLMLTFFGFYQWYHKLQKYEDKKAKLTEPGTK